MFDIIKLFSFIQYPEKISSTWVQQVKMNWLALLQTASIKYDLMKKSKKQNAILSKLLVYICMIYINVYVYIYICNIIYIIYNIYIIYVIYMIYIIYT